METPLKIVKALADGNRMRVIAALMEREELCVCQLTEMLQLATGTVSRHMSILQGARLVQSRKDGRWVHYRIADPFPEALRNWLWDSLTKSPEIKTDRKRLKTITACKVEK